MTPVLRLAFVLLVVVFVVYDAVESRGLRSDYKTHSLFRQHLLKQRGIISKVKSLFGRNPETTHQPEPPVAQNTPGNDVIQEADETSEEKPGDSDETPGEDNASTESPEENDDTPENTPSIDVEVNTPGDDVVVVVESTKPPCDEELFTCGNGECALQSWLCDGDDDCGDGSDEVGCEPRTCPPGSFVCASHRCIPARYVCDGDNDCGDRSDEVNCTGGPGPGPGPVPPGQCPDGFFSFGSNPSQCLQAVLYALQWQAAADFCSALHPKAHLQVIDTRAQLSGLHEMFEHVSHNQLFSQSCPRWWTAGRRVDNSVADSPFVWDICSGRSSTQQENCLSTSNLNSYWLSRGGQDFAEGQPACVAFSISTPQLPWSAISCESHACSICIFTP